MNPFMLIVLSFILFCMYKNHEIKHINVLMVINPYSSQIKKKDILTEFQWHWIQDKVFHILHEKKIIGPEMQFNFSLKSKWFQSEVKNQRNKEKNWFTCLIMKKCLTSYSYQL